MPNPEGRHELCHHRGCWSPANVIKFMGDITGPSACAVFGFGEYDFAAEGLERDLYSSPLPKMASFSCCALMNASLNRLASVNTSAKSFINSHRSCTRTLGVAEANGQSASLWLTLRHVCSSVPHPASVAANVWRKLHVGNHCIAR